MSKRYGIFIALALTLYAQPMIARETIWQCGQEFTDDLIALSRKECHLLKNNSISALPVFRIPRDQQRVRDITARTILESELRQAEQRYIELSRTTEKTANEQKVIMRIQGDIAGLRREIERIR